MTMNSVRTLVPLCLLLLGVAAPALAEPQTTPGDRLGRANTWSARSSTGQTFGGTWTAARDRKTGAVTGTWTLTDARSSTVARGAWSATKAASGWTGNWRAAASGRSREFSGTWSATVALDGDAPIEELFQQALRTVVSGRWRTGGQSGTWSIQAFD